jgi:ABC-type transporter Mla subunit MlaD
MKLEDLIILSQLHTLIEGIDKMSLDLSKLQTEVSENTSVMQSAMTLLDNLASEIRANAGNQTALNELADNLDANSNALADAVARNTTAQPAENLPVEEPVVEPVEPAPADDTGSTNAELISGSRRNR